MKIAPVACAAACLCLMASSYATQAQDLDQDQDRDREPSLEIVSPKAGAEYDGRLELLLRLRDLPPRRLIVHVRLHETTHGFIVDPHLEPAGTLISTSQPPTWFVGDSWLYLKPGPQEIDIVAFHSDLPEEPLFRKSVAFDIRPAPAGDFPHLSGLHGSLGVAKQQRLVTELQEAAERDPLARQTLDELKEWLFNAREHALVLQARDLKVLNNHYIGALDYERALGVVETGNRLIAWIDRQSTAHREPGTSQRTRPSRAILTLLELATDMNARLGRHDETIEGCRRAIAHAEAMLATATTQDHTRRAYSELRRSLNRKARFHMLLTGNQEAHDKWRTRLRELEARMQD